MASSAASPSVLRTVVFMGSSKSKVAPWGGPARLGTRVLKYVEQYLAARTKCKHEVTVLDPLEIKLPVLEGPAFYYANGTAPEELQRIDRAVRSADCFLVISAEYNHSIPPALSNMMDHIGASAYAFKPCGIITYSAGQWGGMRAAMALRPFLAELGCVSVSRICGIANAQTEFSEDGVPVDAAKWDKMLGGVLNQLEWTAVALKNHRDAAGLPE